MNYIKLVIFFFAVFSIGKMDSFSQKLDFKTIAYYAGPPEKLDSFDFSKLDQIIICFGTLDGNKIHFANKKRIETLKKAVSFKKEFPDLTVLISLGGWGGCKTCSEVFNSDKGRRVFTKSVYKMLKKYDADGIDLDWEYPGIEGYPGHQYLKEDKHNFTLLVKSLRQKLGWDYEISFAAGAFADFIDRSVEWDKIMPLIDRVNMMNYDLTNGYSKVSGHHTPLYSNEKQELSADFAFKMMNDLKISPEKMILGAAFYARIWKDVENVENGIYQPGVFKRGVASHSFDQYFTPEKEFIDYWDDVAKAPFKYSEKEKEFATFDNDESIRLKTQYALENGLGGIMFWQLKDDKFSDGLLDVIHETIENYQKK